jgi:hypothetical protein
MTIFVRQKNLKCKNYFPTNPYNCKRAIAKRETQKDIENSGKNLCHTYNLQYTKYS